MNRPLDVSRALLSVDLAREPDFQIGALRVFPSQRQVLAASEQQTVQPRVMQVFVALVRAKGAVVSREQLIESCWDGVVVGDDAINRSIAKVREIAEIGGCGHFEIETIPRVGYRLILPLAVREQGSPKAEAADEKPARDERALKVKPGSRNRLWKFALLAAAIGVVAVAAVVIARIEWSATKDLAIAVNARGVPVQGSLAAELENVAAARGGFAFYDAPGNSAADFVLDVAAQRTGPGVQADATLTRSGSQDLLWSATLAASDPVLLRQRVTYAAFRVLDCATDASANLRKLDGNQLRLLYSACNRTDSDEADELTIDLWRRAVRADPGNPRALAMLGFLEANSTSASEPELPSGLARVAKSDLQKALALDSAVGVAYAAEETLLPRWEYRARLDLLNRGIERDPDCALLHDMKSGLLSDVGDTELAISSVRRAVDLNPASTVFRNALISTLAYAGYKATAAAELKEAERIWPDSPMIREARARYDFRFGDAAALLRALDNGTAVPNMPTPWEYSIRELLLARAEPTRANIGAAIVAAERLAQRNDPQIPLQNLVFLGAVDQAYAILDKPRAVALLRHDTDILFRVYMRPFQLDRRFPSLLAKLGLWQFWESSGLSPNFCDDKQLPYNCRHEARRLDAGSSGAR